VGVGVAVEVVMDGVGVVVKLGTEDAEAVCEGVWDLVLVTVTDGVPVPVAVYVSVTVRVKVCVGGVPVTVSVIEGVTE
jgi:hypothetical protein